jgi:hypothetical protein
MAGRQAIRAVGEIVLSIMREGCPFTALQVGPDAKFEFAFFNTVVADTPPPEGYCFCLWRVAIGGTPRPKRPAIQAVVAGRPVFPAPPCRQQC